MAHIPISEYTAKVSFHDHWDIPYYGFSWTSDMSAQWLQKKLTDISGQIDKTQRVIKVDMGIGHRKKHNLLAINLNADEVVTRRNDHKDTHVTINTASWQLTQYIIEPYIPHTQERYVCFRTLRDLDEISISLLWQQHIEQQTESLTRWTFSPDHLPSLQECQTFLSQHHLTPDHQNIAMSKMIISLISRCRQHNVCLAEINPLSFVGEQHTPALLDMVVTVDSCAHKTLPSLWAHHFGHLANNTMENKIQELDNTTWASCKRKTLNPHGSIWSVFGWWGASVVAMDTFAQLWLIPKVWNYGELSWNPSFDHFREYLDAIIHHCILPQDTDETQWLCLVWGIASFTHIDVLAQATKEVLESSKEALQPYDLRLVRRRGWPWADKALDIIQELCDAQHIPCFLYNDTQSIAHALHHCAQT